MSAEGSFVRLNGEAYYKISDFREMPPFLINIVSPADVWLFLSSAGGMTAGRVNEQGSIFPYETDDKLHQQLETGPKTLICARGAFWEPFERSILSRWNVTRNLYKACRGTSVIFEEINNDLNLTCAWQFTTSGRFGLVKQTTLLNTGTEPISVQILDGLENILPYHVNPALQATSSTLVDAYKANEWSEDGRLAVYSMTTQINDAPTPVEAMKANVAWTDKRGAKTGLSSAVVRSFIRGADDGFGANAYGCKGAFFVSYAETLASRARVSHRIVADAGYDHCALCRLMKELGGDIGAALDADIRQGNDLLFGIVARADGVQRTRDLPAAASHYLSTLYNLMRGGAFINGYRLDPDDFLAFVRVKNHALAAQPGLNETVRGCRTIMELRDAFTSDKQRLRMALEYLPLSFSRRHGDPSRPWNKFNIRVRDEQGRPIMSYEGNWRDIFQNWEALGASYPEYYENMTARFVSASTADGFNPYRIYREGIDWERLEPNNPFSGLGYWGDHQIIYLLRLLKGFNDYYPDKLLAILDQSLFSYANVPYRIAPFDAMEKDAKHTVFYDAKMDEAISGLCAEIGTDGQLLQKDGSVYLVCLMEKLLVPALCKMANLLPGGGIWMNTQRPEWNDANNAIVGIGLSMVTVYHLRAYFAFLRELVLAADETYQISAEVAIWLRESAALQARGDAKNTGWAFLRSMGHIFDHYRERVYANGFSGQVPVLKSELISWADGCLKLLDETIAVNRGKLFASYNLLGENRSVSPMRPMLEGQSAAVGAALAAPGELAGLLDQMDETLAGERSGAHCLYPVRMTTPFLRKNTLADGFIPDGKILLQDEDGHIHFSSRITTDNELSNALASSAYSNEARAKIRAEYERLFAHSHFTGRSEVMYKFEGIGCVYWHQNAKLALALMETALEHADDIAARNEALRCFERVTGRFPMRQTPLECGALPLEPYSHSSFDGFARQPGMTGQVKESLLMRRGELGVIVRGGCVRFEPSLVRREEFDDSGALSFSLCGTEIIYRRGDTESMEISFADGRESLRLKGHSLPAALSATVFARDQISRITVNG